MEWRQAHHEDGEHEFVLLNMNPKFTTTFDNEMAERWFMHALKEFGRMRKAMAGGIDGEGGVVAHYDSQDETVPETDIEGPMAAGGGGADDGEDIIHVEDSDSDSD